MTESLKEAKAIFRKIALARRDALQPAEHSAHSARITQRLLALDSLRQAKSVMAYISIGSEFDTRALIDHVLAAGKTLVLPRVMGPRRLSLHVVRDLRTDLQVGVWSIHEPIPDRSPEITVAEVDWILTPGVAFTRAGARLGYGGGYYDTLLASAPSSTVCVAAAFSLQIIDTLPAGERDIPVSQVITEQD